MPDATVPSLTEMLSSLDSVPPPALTDEEKEKHRLKLMPDDERMRQVWSWKMRGIPLPNIAKMFDVDVRTVYRWISRLKEEFRKQFEGETAADLLSEQLMTLSDMEAMCLYEAAQLAKDGKKFDPTTGAVTTADPAVVNQQLGNKAKFLKMAIDVRKIQIDVMINTGLIPREPEKMYHTLEEDGKRKEDVSPASATPKDRTQSIAELIEQMQKGRVLK